MPGFEGGAIRGGTRHRRRDLDRCGPSICPLMTQSFSTTRTSSRFGCSRSTYLPEYRFPGTRTPRSRSSLLNGSSPPSSTTASGPRIPAPFADLVAVTGDRRARRLGPEVREPVLDAISERIRTHTWATKPHAATSASYASASASTDRAAWRPASPTARSAAPIWRWTSLRRRTRGPVGPERRVRLRH